MSEQRTQSAHRYAVSTLDRIRKHLDDARAEFYNEEFWECLQDPDTLNGMQEALSKLGRQVRDLIKREESFLPKPPEPQPEEDEEEDEEEEDDTPE